MLITKKVKVKWNSANKKHYENLGYKYTKMKDEFEVDVNHLMNKSRSIVKWECDHCGKPITGPYYKYTKQLKDDGTIYCKKCVASLYGVKTRIKQSLETSISIGEHIINEHSKEFLDKIWSDKNELSPFEVLKNSNIKYWWNCPDGKREPFLRNCDNSIKCDFRCPDCVVYIGEKEIENILLKYNIKYILQYKFENCRSIKPLPFDFYLPDCNVLIEYDGEGHYFPVNFGGMDNDKALDRFIGQKVRDTIKNIYCEQNNIKLIRIPYWDYDNIEEILKQELNI